MIRLDSVSSSQLSLLPTFADRITQVLHSLIFNARRSALLIGEPSMAEILGKFFSRYHSLTLRVRFGFFSELFFFDFYQINFSLNSCLMNNFKTFCFYIFSPFEKVQISQDNNMSEVIVANITRSQWHQQVSKEKMCSKYQLELSLEIIYHSNISQ